MVAKIGLCAAVSALGLGPFTNTPIRKVILGSDPHIGYWVGSWWGDPVNGTHGGLHEVRVVCSQPGSQIHAFVRLFAQFGAPEYQVLLGPADPAFVASSAWPLDLLESHHKHVTRRNKLTVNNSLIMLTVAMRHGIARVWGRARAWRRRCRHLPPPMLVSARRQRGALHSDHDCGRDERGNWPAAMVSHR